MANGTQPDAVTKIVLGVLSSVLVLGIVGGIRMYATQQVMNEKLALLQQDKQKDLDQDKVLDERRRTDSKHWRYLVYLKAQVDEIRHADGLPPAPPPDLGD